MLSNNAVSGYFCTGPNPAIDYDKNPSFNEPLGNKKNLEEQIELDEIATRVKRSIVWPTSPITDEWYNKQHGKLSKVKGIIRFVDVYSRRTDDGKKSKPHHFQLLDVPELARQYLNHKRLYSMFINARDNADEN